MVMTAREARGVKHPKPKVVTAFESIRILLGNNDGRPLSLGGDWTMYAVPSSGSPDSPPFYLVGHKPSPTGDKRSDLWLCHCKDFRYRGSTKHDCAHIIDARREANDIDR